MSLLRVSQEWMVDDHILKLTLTYFNYAFGDLKVQLGFNFWILFPRLGKNIQVMATFFDSDCCGCLE